MNIELFEHNEIAYQKLNNYLKDNQMASIDHATGTGKSFIILKYLYENKNKRILYLTPNYYIFEQIINDHMNKLEISKDDFNKFDNIIYSNLLKLNMEQIASNYDIIVFDEYHRCGAKEWGIKVKELINILQTDYPNKKIIGLTATPTRYLDNERNMNEEIFLGQSISTITLGDAIIKGLLQPPTYINTASSYLEYLKEVEKKLIKKFTYIEDREKYEKELLPIIDIVKNRIEENIDDDNKLLKEQGKYIVFCKTITDIKHCKELILKKFPNRNLEFYELHSLQKKKKNLEQLDLFKKNNNSTNFIFVVDSLNEGIHVDNIDGIFLLKKTYSPIIYFQQLGRLLSFSTKNKNLVVWDMVDNIKNHNVIYSLYNDVIEQAKKFYITDSTNKERYEHIIRNFRIIDNYTGIMCKIRDVERIIDKLSEEELLEIRVSRFVNILSTQYENDETIPIEIKIKQLFMAYNDLYSFYKYITFEQFVKLKTSGINLPSIINISEEEFKANLEGHNTLYEKEISMQLSVFNDFKNYVAINEKIPSILISEEREYAYFIFNEMINCHKVVKKKYIELINKIENVSTFDYCYYMGYSCKKINDYDSFFNSLDYCIQNNILVNKGIFGMFTVLYQNEEIRLKYHMNKYLTTLKYKYNVEDEKKVCFISEKYDAEINPLISEKQRIVSLKRYGLSSLKEENIKLFIKNYVEELKQYIKVNGDVPNHKNKEEFQKYIVFRPLIEKYNMLDEIITALDKSDNLEFNLFLKDLINFINNNNGDYPSDRVLNEEETLLAKKMTKYSKKIGLYKHELDSIRKNKSDSNKWLEQYINFIIINKRYPIIQSNDLEEKNLIIRFIRNENVLSKEEKKLIQETINKFGKSEIIKNTYFERRKVIDSYER